MTPDEAEVKAREIIAAHIDDNPGPQSWVNDPSGIREAIASALLSAAGEWNADMDAAPRDGTEIDVWCPNQDGGYRVAQAWWGGVYQKWRCYGDNGLTWSHQPTHWRHLPAPPETDHTTGAKHDR